MAELNEQQAQDLGEPKKALRSRSGFWFGIIILLVVVGLAGGGFYFLQGLRDQQKDLGNKFEDQMRRDMSDFKDQLSKFDTRVNDVSKKIDDKDQHFTKALDNATQVHNDQLQATQKELTESIAKIQRQLGKTRGDWLIADAEYLLSVANERLHLTGDIHATLEALEAADQRLRESGDTGVIPVREKITEEITLVKSIIEPDIVGTYLKIQTQQDQVENLALLLPFAGKPSTESKTEKTSVDGNGLLDVIGVKHTNQTIESILSPEQAQFIREQLRVKLEMVKMALVQHNKKLYQSALDDAKGSLKKNFIDNAASQKFTSELDKFSAIEIDSQYPDISLSLKMLKDISKLRIESDKAAQTTEPEDKKNVVQDIKPAKSESEAESKKSLAPDEMPSKPEPAVKAVPAKK